MTISEAFELYRQDRIIFANKSPKTLESYVYTEKALLKHLQEDILLSDLTFPVVRTWVNDMKKRNLTSGTIRGYVVNLRAVLNYMSILKYECLNPQLIIVPKRTDATPEFLSPKEVAKLIACIDRTSHCSKRMKTRNKAIIAVLYASGVRASELCSLNKSDIHGNTFSVMGKGRKRRMCMLDERAQKLLQEYLSIRIDSDPALFVEQATGGRMKVKSLQSFFRRLSERCGLEKQIHPHTLRHSLANDLMRKGCHIYPLSRILGHSNIATTQQYFQMYDPEIVEVYNQYHSV